MYFIILSWIILFLFQSFGASEAMLSEIMGLLLVFLIAITANTKLKWEKSIHLLPKIT